jgi:hypothetical protein
MRVAHTCPLPRKTVWGEGVAGQPPLPLDTVGGTSFPPCDCCCRRYGLTAAGNSHCGGDVIRHFRLKDIFHERDFIIVK